MITHIRIKEFNIIQFIREMLVGNTLALKRIAKQEESLKRDPIEHVIVRREDNYKFHFVISGLDGDYEGGHYHAMLQLHPNYPFAAPKLYFYTPNGRFHLNSTICTSYTNYHQEQWTAIWNVRSMIKATISFMTSNEGSYGVVYQSSADKKNMAKQSMKFNLANQNFRRIFWNDYEQLGKKEKDIAVVQEHKKQVVECERDEEDAYNKDLGGQDFKKLLYVAGAISLGVVILTAKIFLKK